MKLFKLILISASLFVFTHLAAQEVDNTEAYYYLEMIPVITTEGDSASLYQVSVVMDASDLDLYGTIYVESSVKTKDLKVSKEERKDNPRIKVQKKNYHLDMQEWSKDEELTVKAKKLDGSKVKLKKHPRGSEFTHKVVSLKSTTRDLKKYKGPDIIEEENPQ